jgi:hypothetical protein
MLTIVFFFVDDEVVGELVGYACIKQFLSFNQETL